MLPATGNMYKALREARGWSRQQVAHEFGVSHQFIGQIERGVRRVPGEIEDEDYSRKLDRTSLESLIALGERKADDHWQTLHSLGLIGRGGNLHLSEPVAAFKSRDLADAVGALMLALGHRGVAVVPCWSSAVGNPDETVLDTGGSGPTLLRIAKYLEGVAEGGLRAGPEVNTT